MFKFSVLTPYLPLLESAVWVTLKFNVLFHLPGVHWRLYPGTDHHLEK